MLGMKLLAGRRQPPLQRVGAVQGTPFPSVVLKRTLFVFIANLYRVYDSLQRICV